MPALLERRGFDGLVEIRDAPEGRAGPGTLTGYALKFDRTSRDLGGWFEIIDRAALGPVGPNGELDLDRHIRVMARTNHDSNQLIGTTDAGTLRVFVDEVGARYEIDLPDTSHGRDVAVLAARGDLRFSSFAFRLTPDGSSWDYDAEGRLIRRVTDLRLVDVAPVADPAYWDTTSEVSRDLDLDAIRAELDDRNNPGPAAPVVESIPNTRAVIVGRAREIALAMTKGTLA